MRRIILPVDTSEGSALCAYASNSFLRVRSEVSSWLVALAAQSRELRIVHEAAAALGDVDKVRAVRTMVLEGGGEVFALGQNLTLDGRLLKWQVTEYRRFIDFERGRWRDESTQTAAFVTGWPDPAKVIAAYDDDVAFDVEEGQASRLDAITARDRRAEIYHQPIGFLRAALADGAKLERARTKSGYDAGGSDRQQTASASRSTSIATGAHRGASSRRVTSRRSETSRSRRRSAISPPPLPGRPPNPVA